MGTELISWEVKIRGVGGPMAEFWDRAYQVRTESMPDALAQALDAYKRDDESRRGNWVARFGDSHHAQLMHEVVSVSIHPGVTVRAL